MITGKWKNQKELLLVVSAPFPYKIVPVMDFGLLFFLGKVKQPFQVDCVGHSLRSTVACCTTHWGQTNKESLKMHMQAWHGKRAENLFGSHRAGGGLVPGFYLFFVLGEI